MKHALLPAALALALAGVSRLYALDLWQHSEAAEKGSLFVNLSFVSLSLDDGPAFPRFAANADFLPPLPLPFSFGAFLHAQSQTLKTSASAPLSI